MSRNWSSSCRFTPFSVRTSKFFCRHATSCKSVRYSFVILLRWWEISLQVQVHEINFQTTLIFSTCCAVCVSTWIVLTCPCNGPQHSWVQNSHRCIPTRAALVFIRVRCTLIMRHFHYVAAQSTSAWQTVTYDVCSVLIVLEHECVGICPFSHGIIISINCNSWTWTLLFE